MTFLLLKNLGRDEGTINLKQDTTSAFMLSGRWCKKKDHRFTVAILQSPQAEARLSYKMKGYRKGNFAEGYKPPNYLKLSVLPLGAA